MGNSDMKTRMLIEMWTVKVVLLRFLRGTRTLLGIELAAICIYAGKEVGYLLLVSWNFE